MDGPHDLGGRTKSGPVVWAVFGLPPTWYNDPADRSRMVREPRVLLAEMGCHLDPSVGIKVWDSSAQARYLVLPLLPERFADLREEQLARLVTRDAMVGVSRL
jgi:nitrile hydratase